MGLVVLSTAVACDDPADDGGGDSGAQVDDGADGGEDAPGDGPADGADGPNDGDGGDGEDGGDDPFGAVAAHNTVRAMAQPAPNPALPEVVWDPEIAAVAQAWADGCVFEHSDSPYGENLYIGSGTPTAAEAIQAWADEAAMYDYATGGCSGVCGHYTQLVWRSTARIGCGFADCDAPQGVSFAGRIWVCNYDPPGNFIGEKPY